MIVSSVCHEHYDHPNNLQIESDAFCASGLVMGFLLWEEGSGKQDLRVVVWRSFFFKQKTAYEISACLVGSEMCIRDRSRVDHALRPIFMF